uniref:Uncharacterized protein n=1 Tax=Anas zonorhyncha TaxID=75864 RepID=A0A8B9ZQQ8_9AVES
GAPKHPRGGKRGDPKHCSPSPRLDLGKKESTPQDVMLEELSLSTNRGSQLFQQRQRRKAGLEGTANERPVGTWGGSSERSHPKADPAGIAMRCHGDPQEHPPSSGPGRRPPTQLAQQQQMPPLPLAGYSAPLREVPPEKFNVTAIPKGYRSPWQGLLSDKDKAVGRENHSLLPAFFPFQPQHLFVGRDRGKGTALNNAFPRAASPLSHAAVLFQGPSCYLIQMDANLTPSLLPPPLILH